MNLHRLNIELKIAWLLHSDLRNILMWKFEKAPKKRAISHQLPWKKKSHSLPEKYNFLFSIVFYSIKKKIDILLKKNLTLERTSFFWGFGKVDTWRIWIHAYPKWEKKIIPEFSYPQKLPPNGKTTPITWKYFDSISHRLILVEIEKWSFQNTSWDFEELRDQSTLMNLLLNWEKSTPQCIKC